MSRYLNQNKSLFLHIPKTGGTWIVEALIAANIDFSKAYRHRIGCPRNHYLLGHARKSFLRSINKIFAFVRHPVAYYESTWSYLQRKGSRSRRKLLRFDWEPLQPASKMWNMDFNIWVESMLRENPLWLTRMYESYLGPEGGEFCHFIGRTERLNSDFLKILKLLGYEIDAEKIKNVAPLNVSNNKHLIGWDASLKEQVLCSERLVLKRFYGDNFNKIQFIGDPVRI